MAPKPNSSGKLLCACRRHQCRQFIEAETSASRRFWGSSQPSNAPDHSWTLDFVGITVSSGEPSLPTAPPLRTVHEGFRLTRLKPSQMSCVRTRSVGNDAGYVE